LNLPSCDILSAPTTPHLTVPALSITSLSLTDNRSLRSPLNPASLSFVRSLTVSLSYDIYPKISALLPQLTSLIITNKLPPSIAQCVTLSTSLKILSLALHAIACLNSDTQAIIRDRIEILRIVILGTSSANPHTALSAIVSGSRVIKKVIVDGSHSSRHGATVDTAMNIVIPMCKKAKVELLRENFEVGNGKVDLDSK
jgi:hypothetical protein